MHDFEIHDKKHFWIVVTICATVILAIVILSVWGYHAQQVAAQKEIEKTKIEQIQSTERTEERSQFWQKLIPWGSDEEEAAK